MTLLDVFFQRRTILEQQRGSESLDLSAQQTIPFQMNNKRQNHQKLVKEGGHVIRSLGRANDTIRTSLDSAGILDWLRTLDERDGELLRSHCVSSQSAPVR
jgi:hypothetical protein